MSFVEGMRLLAGASADLRHIARRGVVLRSLLRLAEICEELAERQEKVLVFTQFREIIDPLAEHLAAVFGRTGLVLHGATGAGCWWTASRATTGRRSSSCR